MKNSPTELQKSHRPEAIQQRLKQQTESKSISAVILGGIDGCITTFAIVAGAVGAGLSASIALVLGFANLLADGFSMAISHYESIKAESDFIENIRRTEQDHIEKIPEGEEEEIRQIFSNKGFSGETLNSIVSTIIQDQKLWIDTMLKEEHGLQSNTHSPWKPALITFVSFIIIGAIPLLPFIINIQTIQQQFISSTVLAACIFFAVGMLKSLLFSKPILRAGLSTLLTGGTAAALAYITGYVLREYFGIL